MEIDVYFKLTYKSVNGFSKRYNQKDQKTAADVASKKKRRSN